MRAVLVFTGLLLPQAAFAVNWSPAPSYAPGPAWLQAVYYDSMNNVNIKEGIVFFSENSGETPLPYADLEAGGNGQKVTMGLGVGHSGGDFFLARIGVSMANFRTQKLAGVEAVLSVGRSAGYEGNYLHVPEGLSIKVGYYVGRDHTPNRFMIGFGFGL